MKVKNISKKWKKNIASIFHKNNIDCLDFDTNIRLQFEDSSSVCFNYVNCILDKELDEILILTEHLGYHVFPYAQGGTIIEELTEECNGGHFNKISNSKVL